jgi:hypothetical protein
MGQTKVLGGLIEGAGTAWQEGLKTTNFTAIAGEGYFVNTTSTEITVTLPAGVVGTEIVIQDYAGTFATNKVIFASNGSEKIQGSTDDYKCIINNATVTLIYQDATKGWNADNIETNAASSVPLTVHYLVVAGGGSGGSNSNSGGGGAGGYRTNYGGTALSLNVATNYNVTVGGGAAATTSSPWNGTVGSNSDFNNISATGGGGGSGQGGSSSSGGSGGGGAYDTNGNSGNAGGYSPVEGYAGGNGQASGSHPGGGGGGASESGNTDGAGYGGDGASNSITGSAVVYAGGGSGGVSAGYSIIPGGDGGGGAGSNNSALGTSGTPNTGGGAGGGSGGYGGGAGGSGIVILRYPSGYTISGLSGHHTTTTVGTDKVTSFTSGTGTISFS